jgi:hypothetical protein
VLSAHHHRLDALRLIVLVLDRHLALAVGPEEVDLASAAYAGEISHQIVRVHDRGRHQLGRFVAGVAEHQTLVAGALLLEQTLALGDALRDVARLRLDCRQHAASLPIEAHARARVTDVANHFALPRAAKSMRA